MHTRNRLDLSCYQSYIVFPEVLCELDLKNVGFVLQRAEMQATAFLYSTLFSQSFQYVSPWNTSRVSLTYSISIRRAESSSVVAWARSSQRDRAIRTEGFYSRPFCDGELSSVCLPSEGRKHMLSPEQVKIIAEILGCLWYWVDSINVSEHLTRGLVTGKGKLGVCPMWQGASTGWRLVTM